MSSIIVFGNKNKITQTSGKEGNNTFPKCEVKKSFWGGWKWKVELGDSKTEGSINSLTNSFIQQFNGVTISGNKSRYNDNKYLIVVSYKEQSKIFTIQGGKVTES